MMYQIDRDKQIRHYRHSEKLNQFWESSDAMCLQLAEKHKEIILSFSLGKDSIAAAFQCFRFFERVEMVYMYDVPNLQIINEAIEYYENFFGVKILKCPSPTLLNRLYDFAYQTPNRLNYIESFYLPMFENNVQGYDEIFAAAKNHFRMSDNYLVADGVRAEDNLNRWSSIKKRGGVIWSRRQLRVTYDWNVDEVYDAIEKANCKLPKDYPIWGRTLDGIDYKFMKGLKESHPLDFEKVVTFYPLLGMEFLRYENPKVGARTQNLERLKYLGY